VFKNDEYSFELRSIYYIHLITLNNKIIGKLPFKLLSIKDDEDILEDYYNKLYSYLDTYLSNLQFKDYPCYIGIYLSSYNKNRIYN